MGPVTLPRFDARHISGISSWTHKSVHVSFISGEEKKLPRQEYRRRKRDFRTWGKRHPKKLDIVLRIDLIDNIQRSLCYVECLSTEGPMNG